ncbi:hypothetical protein F4677DRAFT_448456 [Hypoxylon crocopeplum]|nr:hypothetical protein F4677DRAFT_448456 [Hypoxylon crocopeplum]
MKDADTAWKQKLQATVSNVVGLETPVGLLREVCYCQSLCQAAKPIIAAFITILPTWKQAPNMPAISNAVHNAVPNPSTNGLQRNTGERSDDEDAVGPEGIHGADDDSRVPESIIVVPAVEAVDAADDGSVDAISRLVATHDEHDKAYPQTRHGAEVEGLPRTQQHVFLSDPCCDHLVDRGAWLFGFDIGVDGQHRGFRLVGGNDRVPAGTD